jgi:arsenate reductase
MLFIFYPQCGTCRKAKKWLDDHGVSCRERDIVSDNPTEDELRTWHQAAGIDLKKFFNTSGQLYRSMNLKVRLPQMGEDEMYALLAENGMLVKRPVLVLDDGRVIIGFREEQYESLFDKGV